MSYKFNPFTCRLDFYELPISNKWTNATRPEGVGDDFIGYNLEEKRIEFYVASEGKWYYLWQWDVDLFPPVPPTLFSEDFETGWDVQGGITLLFSESFDMGWFINNTFSSLYGEYFESGWFINNSFTQQFLEDFEGVWT